MDNRHSLNARTLAQNLGSLSSSARMFALNPMRPLKRISKNKLQGILTQGTLITYLSTYVSHYLFSIKIRLFILSCGGVVQLGGLALGSPRLVPLRLRLISLFYSLNVLKY